MQFETFDHVFNYRKYCLCGAVLETEFIHKQIKDDDYVCVRYNGPIDVESNGSVVKIPCSIDSRISPYGEADFDIYANVASSTFRLDARYVHPHAALKQSVMPVENFVKRHFVKDVQKGLDIKISRRCSVPSTNFMYANCKYRYDLLIGPITFDMQKKTLNEFNLISESFTLPGAWEGSGEHANVGMYVINTSFSDNTTVIKYPVRDPKFVIGGMESFKMAADKFQKYPFEPQFLLNKIKTLLLFS